MSDEAPTYKRCTKCGEIKPLEEFSKNKNMKDGRQGNCKSCYKAYCAANREAIRIRSQAYRKANAEAVRKWRKAWWDAHAEEMREYLKVYGVTYRPAHAEKMREYQAQYRLENGDKIRESIKKWDLKNPDAKRAMSSRRRARKKGNGGNFSAAELRAMRIEYAGVCFYCRGQHEPDELTIDHVIPIDQGGRHEAANIVLACGICNSSKGNRRPEQWVDRWYERKQRAKRK